MPSRNVGAATPRRQVMVGRPARLPAQRLQSVSDPMNINPLLKYQRRRKRAAQGRAMPGRRKPFLPRGPGPATCGIEPFPGRRSFLASRREARTRRNAAKRGGAR